MHLGQNILLPNWLTFLWVLWVNTSQKLFLILKNPYGSISHLKPVVHMWIYSSWTLLFSLIYKTYHTFNVIQYLHIVGHRGISVLCKFLVSAVAYSEWLLFSSFSSLSPGGEAVFSNLKIHLKVAPATC